ncbi:T2FB [Enterospora canceri]|nr:T2FB [Enterospora canceri]
MINHFEQLKRGEKYTGLKEMEAHARKKKRQLQEKKRERLDKSDAIDVLFKAFEKHGAWTVKDLADFTGQPVAYIQEIIGEIAVLDKKDYKNTYILKKQFK